jgi:predicted secreted protein
MIIERNNQQTKSGLTWDDLKSGDIVKCISNDGCGTEFDAIYVNDSLDEQPIIIDISDANNITWYDDIENYEIVKIYKNATLTIE